MSPASHLEFGGHERFEAPPEKVFAVVTNLDLLAANIPDAVSTERVDDRTLNCTVQPRFAFLRGTLRLVIHLTEIEPPTIAALAIDGRGIGQSMRIESRLEISPDGAGTLMAWNARVTELKGLVATVGKSLIQAAAGQVIRDAWQKIHDQVGG